MLFSFQECLWFLNRNLDDCLHPIAGTSVSRALLIGDEIVSLTVSEKGNDLIIDTSATDTDDKVLGEIRAYVEEWFDLGRDIEPFYELLDVHPAFGYMARDFVGLRKMGVPDVFESLTWSIIGQQINLTFAYKLKRALVDRYGATVSFGKQSLVTFPGASILASVSVDDLRSLQFSRQKASYIINAAQIFASGQLSKQVLLELSIEERIKALVSLKGVGAWTANYVLMKSLNGVNGLPPGDAGLLKALENHKLLPNRDDQEAVRKIFNEFEGWQSYLVHYLWRSLSLPTSP
jgi:DNA-3-methyladenine glycosylase II